MTALGTIKVGQEISLDKSELKHVQKSKTTDVCEVRTCIALHKERPI